MQVLENAADSTDSADSADSAATAKSYCEYRIIILSLLGEKRKGPLRISDSSATTITTYRYLMFRATGS